MKDVVGELRVGGVVEGLCWMVIDELVCDELDDDIEVWQGCSGILSVMLLCCDTP